MLSRLRALTASVITLFGVAILDGSAAQAAPLATPDEIRASLNAYVAAHPYAVLVTGVIEGGTTAVYTASGKSAAVPVAVDDRLRFQIGSVTKTFTATLLAQMVQSHEVALDDPIQKYLPSGVRAPSYQGTPITLRTLAEQTSGLPRLATNMPFHDLANPYADYTVAMLYDFLSHYTLTRAPGAQFEYSNVGYQLLGQLLANRARTSYAALVQRRILDPLGMNDTVVTGTPVSRAQLAPGHANDGRPVAPWDFGELGGLGSIESDLHDMIVYARANLAAPNGPLGAATALAQEPRVPTGLVPGGVVRVGLAWLTNTRSGITFHDGETGGYFAFVAFDRATQQAVVTLGNVADITIEQLATHLFAPAAVPAPVYAEAPTHSTR
jgi:D-alanyl-D-alanine-carboxypeptidase/D-alanyl-D-alanine-endopeptidase